MGRVSVLSSKELFRKGCSHARGAVKKRILRERLLPYTCEECGLGDEWNGKKLVLRLDHRNGVNNDNRLKNLRFLCPNCDSQTETFCGRNARKPEVAVSSRKRPCIQCASALTFRKLCRSCSAKERYRLTPQSSKIAWPALEVLKERLQRSSFLAVARDLGVSDNALRKHLKRWTVIAPVA